MTDIYVLYFEGAENADGTSESSFIGAYSTQENAEAGLAQVKDLPEFKARPGEFNIYPYKLDRLEWTEGFVTFTAADYEEMRSRWVPKSGDEGPS